MRVLRTLAALGTLALFAGCEGSIDPGQMNFEPGAGGGEGRGSGSGTGGGFVFPGGGGTGSSSGGGVAGSGGGNGTTLVAPNCDPEQYRGMALEQIEAQFTNTVYPTMIRLVGGCQSCHLPSAGRLFTVKSDAQQTFYEARQAGYFKAQPGSILDRLVTTDTSATMPRGGPKWTQDEVNAVGAVSCALVAYENSGVVPADEQFPPQLLQPYTGPAVGSYDNSFLLMPQLQAKVKAVFNDDWKRTGADGGLVDNFQKNLSLFGGVDFQTKFTEARTATPEFLLGLDALAPDVCTRAVGGKTGPFTGLDPLAPIVDLPASSTRVYEAEAADAGVVVSPATGAATKQATGYNFYTNGALLTTVTLPAGSYTVKVKAKPTIDTAGNGPKVEVKFGSQSAGVMTFTDTTQLTEQSLTLTLAAGGDVPVSVAFINDYDNPPLPPAPSGDRNVFIDNFTIVGPAGVGTGTTRETAARTAINTLYTRMLYRPATAAETTATYGLLKDLTALGTQGEAWGGVCQALVQHPDFLFTLPPSFEVTTGAVHQQLLLVDLALRLTGRPPSAAELTALSGGTKTLGDLVDQYLAGTEFRDWYFGRMRLRLESLGTDVTDEPARLWTYLAVTGEPFQHLLDGDFGVDVNFNKVARPAEHGKSGLLTMKGFLSNKPGLPHYNYSARVFTDFMGSIFEVPPEVFDQRGTATAASTVDPKSICFSCHQNLTPLAHQRLRWDDDGNYRTNDPVTGAPIDDSDRGLVPSYAYKGQGLAAFAQSAVKKEAFIRRTLNAQYRLLLGRDMRSSEDERDVYKQLWDITASSGGNLKSILKTIATSRRYQRLP
ncbi:MAG: hypothetical protein K1X89_07185 [Myxococcaceae bacterium]|nr:hypothetical protein [Myxococcaceae bacterium]